MVGSNGQTVWLLPYFHKFKLIGSIPLYLFNVYHHSRRGDCSCFVFEFDLFFRHHHQKIIISFFATANKSNYSIIFVRRGFAGLFLFRLTHRRVSHDCFVLFYFILCVSVFGTCEWVRTYVCFDECLLRARDILFLFLFWLFINYYDGRVLTHTEFTLQIYCLVYYSLAHMNVFIETIYIY